MTGKSFNKGVFAYFSHKTVPMKFRLVLLLSVSTLNLLAQLPSLTSSAFLPVHSTSKNSDSSALIRHDGYISKIDTAHQLPFWVYHRISKKMLEQGVKRKRPGDYPRDPEYTILKRSAYESSGYQHGHMAPAGDFKRDSAMYRDSHFMTNMAPQHGCLNEIGWCYLESMTRNWAAEDSTTITHIVSGYVPGKWIDTLCHTNGLKIYVPAQFFKAIFIEDTLHPERSRAIGFIVPNDYLSKEAAQQAAVSIDEIETLTQLDLFADCTRLSTAQQEKTELHVGRFGWEGYTTDCGSKKCESVYSGKRIHPSKRTKLRCG